MNTTKVTRFEVIDHTTQAKVSNHHGPGRIMVSYDVSVMVSIQDDGRTLKVFLSDKKGEKNG